MARLVLPLGCALTALSVSRADPVISEFMASNKTTLADDDGDHSDWVEIYNPDAAPVNLAGWHLTDNAKKKTKWTFPAVTLPAKSYLVVFASGKDRGGAAAPVHTNFSLDADGEYLGLIKPDGATVVTEFAPTYPPQVADISYGITQPAPGTETPQTGYFRTPTPGAANGGADGLILVERVAFSRAPGPFTGSVTLALSGASAKQKIRCVVAAPSALGAAVAEPTATAAEYTGPIAISSSAIVRAAVFSADGLRHGLPSAAHYVKLADRGSARLDTFSSQLPVVILDNHGLGALLKDDIDHPAWLHLFEPPAGGATRLAGATTAATPMTMTVHGFSSADFPKKSYRLDLVNDLGRDNPLPLLGLPAFDSWILVGPWFYDRSFIRNAYLYALSNRIGRWAPRTRFAEVFFNHGGDALDATDYAGISVLTDKIEVAPGRIDLATISPSDVTAPAITGGYILRIDVPHADKYCWTTDHGFPDTGYSYMMVEEPKLDKLPQVQRDYIRGYVQRMENALHADLAVNWATRTHLDYLDRPSWIDQHLLNAFAKNVDALRRSTYFSKDRRGKLVAGPVWDFDRSLGSSDGRDSDWAGWNGSGDSVDCWNFGWWGLLARDPEFVQAWIDRWQSLRQTEFANSSLTALADTLAAEIGPDAAARDAAQWPDNASAFPGGFAGEIAHLKDWLVRRAEWIDGQFASAPDASASGGTLTITPADGTLLAYTLDGSDPRAIGGALAPGAILTSAPLVLADSANIHVRSYSAGSVAFPGSPWSRPVAGPHSTSPDLAPKSRLVNLSARSLIGTGENILIAGVVVRGETEKGFLTRAVGPTLASLGVAQALPDPVLSIVSCEGAELRRNCGWQDSPDAAILPRLASSVGAFPLAGGSRDSALAPCLPAGLYSVHVSSAASQPGVALVELYEADSAGRAVNFSARGPVGSGDGLLIGGFVVSGATAKRVLVRAVGPTLAAYGVAQPLADPVLTLYQGQNAIASNDQWAAGDDAADIVAATGAAGAFALPADSADAVLLITLNPGVYSILVSGKAGAGGVALVEIYDAD